MTRPFPPLPFELHLTTGPLAATQLPGFEALCQRVGGKALVIELARGQHCQQPMLSLVTADADAPAALARGRALAAEFGAAGYPVRRTKLEVLAWGAAQVRPAAPAGSAYYEWHGRVRCEPLPELRAWCEQYGAHLSANALRNRPGVRFVTLREFGPAARFAERVAALRAGLAAGGWAPAKQQAEFCFYDSQVALDAGWLS